MPTHRVNVRLALERIADAEGLDLVHPGDLDRALGVLCASLRRRVSAANITAIAHAARRCPAAQAAQACRMAQDRRVAR